jgi:hypothetical protein
LLALASELQQRLGWDGEKHAIRGTSQAPSARCLARSTITCALARGDEGKGKEGEGTKQEKEDEVDTSEAERKEEKERQRVHEQTFFPPNRKRKNSRFDGKALIGVDVKRRTKTRTKEREMKETGRNGGCLCLL